MSFPAGVDSIKSAMAMLHVDPELIRRYDCHGPRYTSYPTAVQFHSGFNEAAYRRAAAASERDRPQRPLSLYVHIPFCASPCFYCGCNRIITRGPERAQGYLERLHWEIAAQAALFSRERVVEQLHFGGGTPTFLTAEQLAALVVHLGEHFSLTTAATREYSIEIDPRTVTRETIGTLAGLGFNRMSLGVQDFDPAVQHAINRIQSIEQTQAVIEHARLAGFGSIGVDLIYGLPRQRLESFRRTLQTVIAMRPDRLAVYGYAHLPQVFKAQRRLSAQDLPSPRERLELLRLTVESLTSAGYEYIGMDHFALPDDELVTARRNGSLQRNFQGYSTRARSDLIGLGVSAIGSIGGTYAQSFKTLREYFTAIDAQRLPIWRGLELSREDEIRRTVIQELMCQERLDFHGLSDVLGVDFRRHFAAELERLRPLAADGLVKISNEDVVLSSVGRLLMRNVAMIFDAYLRPETAEPLYSRAI
jgi:oxygen-independent coproporphyrinogen III oxidase